MVLYQRIFKYHSVSLFLKDIITKLKMIKFELIGLSNLEINNYDDMTKKEFKNNFDGWYDISQIDDIELVKLIRSLSLNIIIDLSGFYLQK